MHQIDINLSNRKLHAYFYPADTDKKPGILFLPDLTGINDTLKQSALALSKEGYHVLLPDLFSDMGMPQYCLRVLFTEAIRNNRSKQNPVLDEIHELIDHLKAVPGVDSERIGMIGQCLSGGFALHMAIRPDVKAPVVFHHGFGREGSGIPEEDAKKICKPIQGHFARFDAITTEKMVTRLRLQLKDNLHYHYYTMLPHGIPHFFRRSDQGNRAWHTMLQFFRMQLQD